MLLKMNWKYVWLLIKNQSKFKFKRNTHKNISHDEDFVNLWTLSTDKTKQKQYLSQDMWFVRETASRGSHNPQIMRFLLVNVPEDTVQNRWSVSLMCNQNTSPKIWICIRRRVRRTSCSDTDCGVQKGGITGRIKLIENLGSEPKKNCYHAHTPTLDFILLLSDSWVFDLRAIDVIRRRLLWPNTFHRLYHVTPSAGRT